MINFKRGILARVNIPSERPIPSDHKMGLKRSGIVEKNTKYTHKWIVGARFDSFYFSPDTKYIGESIAIVIENVENYFSLK